MRLHSPQSMRRATALGTSRTTEVRPLKAQPNCWPGHPEVGTFDTGEDVGPAMHSRIESRISLRLGPHSDDMGRVAHAVCGRPREAAAVGS